MHNMLEAGSCPNTGQLEVIKSSGNRQHAPALRSIRQVASAKHLQHSTLQGPQR